MKKILFILSFIAVAGIAMAQKGDSHQVGDTVRGMCPFYYYQWWPTIDTNKLTDSTRFTIPNAVSGYMKHTTDTPLKVIGIASTLARLYTQTATPYEDLDPTIEPAMDYVLFDATAGGLVEKARVRWTDDYMTHPKRYMELPIMTGPCSNIEDHTTIVSLREYYFDSAITVTDSFYLGCDYKEITIHDGDTNAFAAFAYYASHYWEYCAYGMWEGSMYSDCAADVPEYTYYDSSSLDNTWHYYTRKRFQLIFPILEVDTVLLHTVSLYVTDLGLGSVTGAGNYPDSSLVTISATPDSGYVFGMWSDGDSNAVRTILVTSDTVLWATFYPDTTTQAITQSSDQAFALYPNPAKGMVTLKCADPMQGSAEIIDMQGKCWYRKALSSQQTEFDVSALPEGTYLVCITTADGKQHTVRLLKQSDISVR